MRARTNFDRRNNFWFRTFFSETLKILKYSTQTNELDLFRQIFEIQDSSLIALQSDEIYSVDFMRYCIYILLPTSPLHQFLSHISGVELAITAFIYCMRIDFAAAAASANVTNTTVGAAAAAVRCVCLRLVSLWLSPITNAHNRQQQKN